MNLGVNSVAPLIIQDISSDTRFMRFLVCLVILGVSVGFSKRGAIAEEKHG